MRTITLFAAAMLMTVVAVAPAASAASGEYIGGLDVVNCDVEDALGACLGGYVFDVEDEERVTITIADENVEPVGAFYTFSDADNDDPTAPAPASGAMCGSITVDVPSEADSLQVNVDTAFGPLDCAGNPPGAGTVGTITADFFTLV